LQIRKEINDILGCANTLNNSGVLYYRQKNYDKAMEYYEQSLKYLKGLEEGDLLSLVLCNISCLLFDKGKATEALPYAIRSLEISKKIGYIEYIKFSANSLSKIYKKQNKYKEALEMFELEVQMRDSTNNLANRKTSIKKQFQYEYEKQAAADSVKHAEEQKVKNALLVAQSASLKQEKTQRYALYGGLLLVIGFSVFVFNRFRVTQKQKKVIEEQKVLVDAAYEQLHEKNKEVMDSITYARRIQRALITPEIYIDRALNKLNKNS
jgi:tetratricopeptide (TPR) repeat protein